MEIDFFRKQNGDCPVQKYLESLNPKLRAKTLRSIMLLEEFGENLRMPISKSLGNGLFELRTVFGSDTTRVIYFFVIDNKAILTHGFTKKTQKTPPSEIEKANEYRTEYFKNR